MFTNRVYSRPINVKNLKKFDTSMKNPVFFDGMIDKHASLREENVTFVQRMNEEDTDGGNLWRDSEVKFLISLYGEHLIDFKNAKRKKQMWHIIAEKMQCQGYNRNADKCQRKWINMTCAYRSVKDNRRPTSSGRGKATYKYFEALDEILGDRPSNSTDTFVVNMGCSYENVEPQNIKQTESNNDNENTIETEEVHIGKENTVPDNEVSNNGMKRRRKNYTQEYYKTRIEYLKRDKADMKEKRYLERLELENKRLNLEEKKIALLENILGKLERN
ncbi:hypothetical protein ABEB36_000238 [Hypothenemus hampei]|uniref:Myb-like domain-containing protein n=1 Tax=Hypothenemus hampei TaxID=57062 RepID=A0ABD1FAL1_HYPHA